jgi:hypothetical protein
VLTQLNLKHRHAPFVGFDEFTYEIEARYILFLFQICQLACSIGLTVAFAQKDLRNKHMRIQFYEEELHHRSWQSDHALDVSDQVYSFLEFFCVF